MKKNKSNNVNKGTVQCVKMNFATVFCALLAFVLFLEIFIFNFKWITSFGANEINTADIRYESAEEANGKIKINSDNASIIFENVNSEIKYIYINPGAGNLCTLNISATDEANVVPLSAPQRKILGDVKASQYIRLHYSGNIKTLRLSVQGMNGRSFSSDGIKLNTNVPMMFSILRVVILLFLFCVIYLLRPGSPLYSIKTNMKDSCQRIIAAGLVIVQAISLLMMINWNTTITGLHKSMEHHRQYYSLLESFKEGRLDIPDENMPKALTDMENPYDIGARGQAGISTQIKWDHAFYEGKYYVYFGVVPAVLLYLPYKIITGADLPNVSAVYILCVLSMIGIMMLLWQIIKKWFKNTPLIVYLLLSVVFAATSIAGYAVYKPDFYLVPSAAALCLGLFGLALWLSAQKETDKGMKISAVRLAFGSLFLALIAGCRPQMFIGVSLGVLFLWDAVFKERKLFSKDSIKETIALCAPFVVVALILMWYNFARFGSPFDFGANYNLTTNDMTKRGFFFGRIGLGLFSYLFQPLNVNAVFPFVHDFAAATVYQGRTLTEMMIGGIFFIFPIMLFGLYGMIKKEIFKEKKSYTAILICMICTAVLVVVDTQMAGLLTRYFCDFAWLLMIASSITVFALFERANDGEKIFKAPSATVLGLSLVTLLFVFLRIFAHSEDSIMVANPTLYYKVMHLFAFWV